MSCLCGASDLCVGLSDLRLGKLGGSNELVCSDLVELGGKDSHGTRRIPERTA